MADDKAVIRAELDGTAEVAAKAKGLQDILRNAEKDAKKTADAVAKGGKETAQVGSGIDALMSKVSVRGMLGATLGGFALGGISQVMSYLNRAADAAQNFGEKTSATSRRAGVDLSALRSTVAKNETTTLQGVDAQSDFVAALAKTTYNGKGAMESLRSVGIAALASSRDLSEMLPVVASLQSMGIKGDVGDELQRIGDMAQRLKTIGGPQALLDGVANLRGSFEQINLASAAARANLEGFFAVLSKDRKPAAAQNVLSGAVGWIKGRALDIERTLGRSVVADNGEIESPMTVLEDLQKVLRRKYPGNKAAQRRAAIGELGVDMGTAVYSTDFSKVRDAGFQAVSGGGSILSLDRKGPIQAPTLGQLTDTEKAAAEYLDSDEGRRRKRDISSTALAESVGRAPLAARDAVDTVVSETGKAAGAVVNGIGEAINLSPSSAAAIGQATADALAKNPPKLELPRDPNAPRGN